MMRREAQAIVMAAGSGSRMTTVIGIRPKCLLPVGNFPMIYYPLRFLQDAGFDEVTIIVGTEEEREVHKLSEQYALKLRLDIVTVDTSDDPGTAESLRLIESKIKKNVDEIVIVSSDMITDAAFKPMMNHHRSKGAALTMLTAKQAASFVKAVPPGPKTKMTLNKDIICTERGTNHLVYAVAGGDYDEVVNISKPAIEGIDSDEIELRTDLIDGHLYIMKRWLVDYIVHKESPCRLMGSLKAEVIPHIIAEQFSPRPSNPQTFSIHKFIKSARFEDLIKKYNTSAVASRFQHGNKLDARVCYSFHHSGFIARINTLGNLWQINREVNEFYELLKMRSGKYVKGSSDEIHEKAQISGETVIGRSTQIAEKTNINNCVIGHHCRIKNLVRITDSVLFDYVNVVEGCVIENSLVCVNIEKKCILKNCTITDPTKIRENRTYENELLEVSQDYTD